MSVNKNDTVPVGLRVWSCSIGVSFSPAAATSYWVFSQAGVAGPEVPSIARWLEDTGFVHIGSDTGITDHTNWKFPPDWE